jgi:hypothetical protein
LMDERELEAGRESRVQRGWLLSCQHATPPDRMPRCLLIPGHTRTYAPLSLSSSSSCWAGGHGQAAAASSSNTAIILPSGAWLFGFGCLLCWVLGVFCIGGKSVDSIEPREHSIHPSIDQSVDRSTHRSKALCGRQSKKPLRAGHYELVVFVKRKKHAAFQNHLSATSFHPKPSLLHAAFSFCIAFCPTLSLLAILQATFTWYK